MSTEKRTDHKKVQSWWQTEIIDMRPEKSESEAMIWRN